MSLAWPNHVHHVPARAWFRGLDAEAWATTPMTEAGFVRISSNSTAIPGAVTPGEALQLLARLAALPRHQFVPDAVQQVVGEHLDRSRVVSHLQVTDAHLLAVAREHGARLATFDRGVASLARGEDVQLVPFD